MVCGGGVVGCCGGEADLVLLWPGPEGALVVPEGRRERSGEAPPAPVVEAI